jgi:chromosomal replication initiator protein
MESKISPYILPGMQRKAETEPIINTVAEHFGFTAQDLKSKTRLREIVMPRQIAMFIMYQKITRITYREVGLAFYKDHATVIYALKTVRGLYDIDKAYRNIVDEILKKIVI